jgi:rod shape-determining protein MreB and related proteins
VRILNPFARLQLALDVGTATTRACSASSRILESESVIREPGDSDDCAAMRREALRGGVVRDIAAAATVIEPMVSRLRLRGGDAGALLAINSDASPSERNALVEAVTEAGAVVVALVPAPLAAAIGAGVDVTSGHLTLVADLGDGLCDLAVIRDGAVVRTRALRIGCSDARTAVLDWLAWHRGLDAEPETADRLLRAYCAPASTPTFDLTARRGDGSSWTERVTRDDLAVLIEPVAARIASFIAMMVRELPEREAAEVFESGIHLSGGGALLDLFVRRIESACGLHAIVSPDPLWAVIGGIREMLDAGVIPGSRLEEVS